jgi:hypothetical protein
MKKSGSHKQKKKPEVFSSEHEQDEELIFHAAATDCPENVCRSSGSSPKGASLSSCFFTRSQSFLHHRVFLNGAVLTA